MLVYSIIKLLSKPTGHNHGWRGTARFTVTTVSVATPQGNATGNPAIGLPLVDIRQMVNGDSEEVVFSFKTFHFSD